jgi:hypothetical protein
MSFSDSLPVLDLITIFGLPIFGLLFCTKPLK